MKLYNLSDRELKNKSHKVLNTHTQIITMWADGCIN